MEGESQEVKIIGVEKEGIAMSPNKKEIWVVPFKLSLSPDKFWQKKFYEVQQKDVSVMKRPVEVVDNLMRMEVSSADDLQKLLDILRLEVAQTNVLSEEDYQRKIKIHQELESLQKKQRDSTQQFKDDSDKLTF